MTILAQSEQHQIELTDLFELTFIIGGRQFRSEFTPYHMDLFGWNSHTIQPLCTRHIAVASGVFGGQASFIAIIDMPRRPVGIGCAQCSINMARRIATGQYDAKDAARRDRSFCSLENEPVGSSFHGDFAIEFVPAA